MHQLHFFAIAVCAVFGLLLNWRIENYFHNRRLRTKKLRIHVNGIRGKSTVTRNLAGLLRAANYHTIAKTTGSAACLIDPQGNDHAIRRNGSPTILEQVNIIRGLSPEVDALVIECMAIKPEYQRICEEKIVRSNIGVITNVREDHQDVLGFSLREIAGNLALTFPIDGVLITSEQSPDLLRLFRSVAEQRNTKLVVANPDDVTDLELNQFPYVAFKENIAIGLELAKVLGIDRSQALLGMAEAAPDPGALRIEQTSFQNRELTWCDLFAVNDRESVITCRQRIDSFTSRDSVKIGLLNNRADREQRALQFARIAALDLQLDFIALLGAYEKQVEAEILKQGYPSENIIRLGAQRGILGQKLIEELLRKTNKQHIVLLGLVNIHTAQATSVREFFFGNADGGNDEPC